MAKKQSKLLTIYDNVVLREKVNEALDNNESYSDIIKICKEYGIDVSSSSITRYAEKRIEAIKTNQDLRALLDTDTERAIANIKKKQVDKPKVTEDKEPDLVKTTSVSQQYMLERIINYNYPFFVNGEVKLAPKDFLSAIKLYTQLNGNNNHGLTTEGLQQLRLFQHAQNSALAQVVLKYVPKAKREDVLKDLKEAEEKQYREWETSGNGKAILEALNIGNQEEGDNL